MTDFVFFRLCRTSTIDQHPAGPQARSHRFEDLDLQSLMACERFCCPSATSPQDVVANSETAAWGIHENPITAHGDGPFL